MIQLKFPFPRQAEKRAVGIGAQGSSERHQRAPAVTGVDGGPVLVPVQQTQAPETRGFVP